MTNNEKLAKLCSMLIGNYGGIIELYGCEVLKFTKVVDISRTGVTVLKDNNKYAIIKITGIKNVT